MLATVCTDTPTARPMARSDSGGLCRRSSSILERGREGRAAGVLALGLGPLHAGLHPLGDQRALELGQTRHDAEQQLALRGRGVGPLVVADEVDAQALKLGKRVDQL